MFISSFFSGFRIPFNRLWLFFDFITVQIVESNLSFFYTGHFQISDIIHISGIFQNCRYIRCNIRFAVFHAENHRAVFSCHINFFRIILEHNCQRIRATDADHRMINGIYRRSKVFFIIIVYQFDCYFCICRRIECITFTCKFIFQFLVVFDDSVVYSNDISIVAHMRVRINFRWLSMGCPSGMADSTGSGNGLSIVRLFCKNFQSTFGFDNFYIFFSVTHCESC